MLAIIIPVAIAVLIPLIIWIRKSYFLGPELTLEFKKDGSGSSPKGFSNRNIPVDGVIEMRDAIQIFEIKWDIDLIITNNSEYTAYYPKIMFKETQPPFLRIEKLNELEPIASKETKTIRAVFQEIEEAKGSERNKMVGLPEPLQNIQILLEYKNSSKKKFYTLYDNTHKKNNFSSLKPKVFK